VFIDVMRVEAANQPLNLGLLLHNLASRRLYKTPHFLTAAIRLQNVPGPYFFYHTPIWEPTSASRSNRADVSKGRIIIPGRLMLPTFTVIAFRNAFVCCAYNAFMSFLYYSSSVTSTCQDFALTRLNH
jgi:hypothetical protein